MSFFSVAICVVGTYLVAQAFASALPAFLLIAMYLLAHMFNIFGLYSMPSEDDDALFFAATLNPLANIALQFGYVHDASAFPRPPVEIDWRFVRGFVHCKSNLNLLNVGLWNKDIIHYVSAAGTKTDRPSSLTISENRLLLHAWQLWHW